MIVRVDAGPSRRGDRAVGITRDGGSRRAMDSDDRGDQRSGAAGRLGRRTIRAGAVGLKRVNTGEARRMDESRPVVTEMHPQGFLPVSWTTILAHPMSWIYRCPQPKRGRHTPLVVSR
ncbi:hypothetical protein FRACA_930001 [Frankia canadensis]|uniref:Uncharacterized protein n=1 Tax=Frankia canadensis TaxID=1836972 RepID=A0A2I2L2I0_9ACTN|nr:hypothetical protein FRACA_930001 [Frankia canadensis]SOU59426.1 hypothetical protein FRACA_930001 [Frankia canadensis]